MADVLSCGPDAVVSHLTAAGVWGIRSLPLIVEITVPAGRRVRRSEVNVHRRALSPEDRTRHRGIPVTSPIQTLIDLATRLGRDPLEGAINEADKLDLVDPETLRGALDERAGEPGIAPLRRTLDRRTFTMTDTELEQRRSSRSPGGSGWRCR